jgi:hypothetical protein
MRFCGLGVGVFIVLIEFPPNGGYEKYLHGATSQTTAFFKIALTFITKFALMKHISG